MEKRNAGKGVIGIRLDDPTTGILCTASLKDGREESFRVQLTDPQCVEFAAEGYEYAYATANGPYCIVNLLSCDGQWGRCLVWNAAEDRLVHNSSSAFGYRSAICGNKVVTLHVVCYWGKPAQAAYSVAPLEALDVRRDWGLTWLDLPIPDGYYEPGVLDIRAVPGGAVLTVGDVSQFVELVACKA